jgi:hypothetical protein
LKFVPAALAVIALFAGGWLLGRVQSGARDADTGPSPVLRALRIMGLAAPRFVCALSSRPDGASVAVDGKSLDRKTPTVLELPPGEHTLSLTLPDLGSASFTVKGTRTERIPLNLDLSGSLSIRSSEAQRPIQVSVDGVERGYAPVTIPELSPGAHDVRFATPGLPPWGQTVRVGVREQGELIARPFESPATGLIEVRAAMTEDDGVEAIKGATIWVDGRRHGSTPATLELPAGPHSFRVEYRDEVAPVQVIDLPGGNQRFASFQFGLGVDAPRLVLLGAGGPMPRDRASVVSVALEGVTADEVREMWMHVRAPEGVWRRYPMVQLEGSGAVVGVAVFPLALLDEHGRAPYYVSASTTLGDDYFTELQNLEASPPRSLSPVSRRPPRASLPATPPAPVSEQAPETPQTPAPPP